MDYIKLSNGNEMPAMGLGTDDVLFIRKLAHSKNRNIQRLLSLYHGFVLRPYLNHQLSNTIAEAFKMGYRLIDTSSVYQNEEAIGRAIKKSGVPREDLFITSRVSNSDQYNNNVRNSFLSSLNKLGLDHIDLYMFHWPVTDHYLDTWREMEKLYEEGLIKNLGVANCHQHHIQAILDICKVRPVVNQIEIHPLFTQKPLIEFCKKEGIQVEAYSPLAQGNDRLRRNRVLLGLGAKYNKSMQQIILRWHIENGVVPIPRSTNKNRLKQNLEVFDFQLTKDEVDSIDGININSRLRYDPDNCDFTIL